MTADDALTEDRFLGGRLIVLQPKDGYRAATDAVLLAAACPAAPRERVLDVGSGVGVASLCLAARVPGVDVEGFELQTDLAALSQRNALRNGVSYLAYVGDIAAPPLTVRATSYDHVITNPPYFVPGAGGVSPNSAKDQAIRETAALADWIDFCLKRLKSKGWLTLVHRAERTPEILAALEGRAGAIALLPVAPRDDEPAKRVVLRAMKDSHAPFRLAAPLVLHAPGEQDLTAAADAVIREGAALEF